MPALPPTFLDRPKRATVFFGFASALAVLSMLAPVLDIWLDGPEDQPPLQLWAIFVAGFVMLVNAFANWRWWVKTSPETNSGWLIAAIEAAPATAISVLIVQPGDMWGYLWVLLVFIVGLLTANITPVLRRAVDAARPMNALVQEEREAEDVSQQ